MRNQSVRVWTLVLCGLLAQEIFANTEQSVETTFYTVLTPDGPMQVEMPVPSRRAEASTVDEPTVALVTPVVVPSTTVFQSGTVPAAPNSTDDSASESPFAEFAGQQYVDTAYLEQREFNLEGRKRFYSLPDGLGGTQVVERESGVKLSSFVPQFERPQTVTLAESYRRLTAAALVDLTNQQCLSAVQLKTAKLLNDKPVDFWPIPSFQPKFEFVLAELAPSLRDIHLISYAATSRQPSYYWPLPIFLDQGGCILEGVAGFYQSKTTATWLQQSALQGHVHVPKDAHYLLLTPLVEAAELSSETLTDRGQLRLTPLRVAAP